MNIAIVDPIFRASRLQYTHMVATRAKELGMDIHLLARTSSYTEQYDELFGEIDHQLYEVAVLPDKFWFGKIPTSQIDALMQKLSTLHQNDTLDAIYFSGGHELFPEIVDIMILEKYRNLRNIPIVMVEYEPNFLLQEHKKAKNLDWIKNRLKQIIYPEVTPPAKPSKIEWYKKLFAKYKKLNVAILDERILDKKVTKRFFYLPDPSPDIDENNYPHKNTTDKINILIVGLQSDRKGFHEIINLLAKYENRLDNISFTFAGRLSEDTEKFRKAITQSEMLNWEEGFFPEEIIRKIYSSCDYVILPYSTAFNSSSGIMAYATAFGKPLITTEHGCVGFRIDYYKMGYTYKYGDVDGLYALIDKLPNAQSKKYQNLSIGCRKFSSAHSIDEHTGKIFTKLGLT